MFGVDMPFVSSLLFNFGDVSIFSGERTIEGEILILYFSSCSYGIEFYLKAL